VITIPTVQLLLTTKLKEIHQNEEMMQFYAKPTCRKCLGRGKIMWQRPDRTTLCDCVLKAIKKEVLG
jgi:hypothetical protein